MSVVAIRITAPEEHLDAAFKAAVQGVGLRRNQVLRQAIQGGELTVIGTHAGCTVRYTADAPRRRMCGPS